jgi:hypothetical protein
MRISRQACSRSFPRLSPARCPARRAWLRASRSRNRGALVLTRCPFTWPQAAADPCSRLRACGLLPVRVDLGNLDVRCLHWRYGDRLQRRYGLRRPGRGRVAASATSASPKSASDGESLASGPAGVIFSKNRSSSTGTGMTSVLLRSEATSTTVCSSRSWSAAGSRAMTLAAAASRLDAWYSPSAVMILARRSRSASAWRDIDRFMLSGSETSLISTRSTRIPHGPSVGSSMIRRS